MNLIKTLKNVFVGSATAVILATPVQAEVIYSTGSGTSEIPGLTGYSTTGSMMNGLSVTAVFADGTSESEVWSATGNGSGGVFGNGWSLTQSGDTWTLGNYWNFSFTGSPAGGPSSLALVSLMLKGGGGFTVFDRSDIAFLPPVAPSGTVGSAEGRSVTFSDSAIDAWVTYFDKVNLSGEDAVGDLFHSVLISFDRRGNDFVESISSNFSFMQDTDNDGRFGQQVPEPGMLGLFGLALAGAAVFARKRWQS